MIDIEISAKISSIQKKIDDIEGTKNA